MGLILLKSNKMIFYFLHQALVSVISIKVKKSAMKSNLRFFKIFNIKFMNSKINFKNIQLLKKSYQRKI